jgi:hypothetical protein
LGVPARKTGKNKKIGTRLALDKNFATGIPLLDGKMVSSGLCWGGLVDLRVLQISFRKHDTANPLSINHGFDKCFAIGILKSVTWGFGGTVRKRVIPNGSMNRHNLFRIVL